MPNWCYNSVNIEGSKEVLNKLIEETTTNEKLDLDKVIPMPKEYSENGRWYEWRLKNWGTKWNVATVDQSFEWVNENEINFSFDSAWSPPIPVLVRLSELYDVYINHFYEEEGYIGRAENDYENGKIKQILYEPLSYDED